MRKKIADIISAKLKTNLVKNSLWGVFSNVFQNILLSVFFIVIARKYSTHDFANYIIANTLYSFVVGFASLGLGNWFIRELINTEDKSSLIDKFFKIQLYVGVLFYLANIIIAFSLYQDQMIRNLSLLIGINILFDNIIYVIKFINVAQYEQRKTFMILTVEAVLKFAIALALLFHPFNILYLAMFLILLRLVTLNLFIRYGSSNLINLRHILKVKVPWTEVKKIIGANWSFVIIASISVIYWRIGSILVSKILADDVAVANYEVSYKLFSLAEILPVIIGTSIYPMLINALKEGMGKMQKVYKQAFPAYALFGLLAFTFIYSYADFFIPWMFGEKYIGTPVYCREMFLTILVFPTALLQANVLVTLKLEKIDMMGNIASLVISLALCFIGFHFFRTLSVVNYSIFISFFVFHVIQDIVLIRRKVTTIAHVLVFYLASAAVVISYYFLAEEFGNTWLFFAYWAVIGSGVLIWFLQNKKKNGRSFFPVINKVAEEGN